MKVFKYKLYTRGLNNLAMPHHAKILSVDKDLDGELCVWCLVSPTHEYVLLPFYVVGTGDEVPTDFPKFVGTVTSNLIYHVFTK